MKILKNSDQYLEQQAELLHEFYQDFGGNAVDYSSIETYRAIVENYNDFRTIYSVIEGTKVKAVMVVDFNGSIFFTSENDEYTIDFIAGQKGPTLKLVDHLIDQVKLPIRFIKQSKLHENIIPELIEKSQDYFCYHYEYEIKKAKSIGVKISEIDNLIEYQNENNEIKITSIDKNAITSIDNIISYLLNFSDNVIINSMVKIEEIKEPFEEYQTRKKLFEIFEQNYGLPKEGKYSFTFDQVS